MYSTLSIVEKLRNQGFHITPQRLAILEFLSHSSTHPSAIDIFQALKPDYPSLSLATVYNTLKILKAIGEVLEIPGGSEGNRYDTNVRPHTNLICLHCQEVQDLAMTVTLQDFWYQELANRSGFDIHQMVLVCYGICPKCQRKRTEERGSE